MNEIAFTVLLMPKVASVLLSGHPPMDGLWDGESSRETGYCMIVRMAIVRMVIMMK